MSDVSTVSSAAASQDLARGLCVDSSVGLTGSAGDGARRAERFGTNRLASREEVTFGQMVLDALEVKHQPIVAQALTCLSAAESGTGSAGES